MVQERLTSSLATQLEAVKSVVPAFAEVFVTDRHGGLLATSDRTSDYYQADEGWWQAAYNEGQGAVFIAPPELDVSTGIIGVDIAVPVYAENSKVVGVLRTTLDATALVSRLADIQLGETGEAHLLIGEEVFVGQGEPEAFDDPTDLAQLETAPEGYIETSYDGQPSLVGYAAVSSPAGKQFISDLGWKVFTHQDRDEALASVTAQTRNTLLLALLVTGITAVVAVAMGQVLASPIARLTDVVTRFTEGDLSARIDIDSSAETGVLAASFNQMAEQVSTLLTDVQARSAELEERTRELEASQSVTFAASERTSPEELLGLVVDLVRDQFDLYHVQMYMVDEEQQAAVLRESTGYAGSQLLQGGHQIPLDQTALVTKAIRDKEPVLVDDTSQYPNFLPNPLLPETQTELVVPLRVSDRVLGALDIQDRKPGRFSESTIALFQAMTDQVAFLFENNELLDRVTDQAEALTVFTTQLRTASDIAEQLWVFLPSNVPPEKMRELALYGAEVIKITGTYDQTKEIATDFATRRGITYDRGAKAIPGKESMKTIAFEIVEQLGWRAPDWYVQAVSGGIGPLGVLKGFTELHEAGLIDHVPEIGVVQVEGCAPMVRAWEEGLAQANPVLHPDTLVIVLATGNPGPAYRILKDANDQYGGAMVSVSDGDAFRAMRRMARVEGFSMEPAASVAFAGLERLNVIVFSRRTTARMVSTWYDSGGLIWLCWI